MYYQNPIVTVTWPTSDQDPVTLSAHQGAHCLFFDPVMQPSMIRTNQTLQDLCDWYNHTVTAHTLPDLCADIWARFYLARLVKQNIWCDHIRKHGVIKPLLVIDDGKNACYTAVGESRLRCLERLPHIRTLPGFVTCHSSVRFRYQHLEIVQSLDHFAALCGAAQGDKFSFRLTDPQARWGLDWYEYHSELTRLCTPDQDSAVRAFVLWYENHCDLKLTPQWFDQVIDWQL